MTQARPQGYRALDLSTLPDYLAGHMAPEQQPGGTPGTWQVREVGDGNLNLVFIVTGTQRSIVVKQALPYVRVAGEGWPMSLQRAYFEYHALSEQRRVAGNTVPEVYFFDEQMSLFAMEYLHPHIILRKGLIAGIVYPTLAQDIGTFLARTLFHTSDLGMPPVRKKELLSRFARNVDLCQITEDLIFTEPYYNAPRNNWNSPELDADVAALWHDEEMIQVAMTYKWKFMTEAQALLHGDLHSGSVMVTEQETRVIDPEFAFYGPMAFDTGNYIANLFLSYFSQRAHRASDTERKNYQSWLLQQVVDTWETFRSEFCRLWTDKVNTPAETSGQAWPNTIYGTEKTQKKWLEQAQKQFFDTLFIDTLVNAGMEINRRTVGFAGVAELKSIKDSVLRAACERRGLKLARQLMVAPGSFSDIRHVARLAEDLEKEQ